MKNGSQKLKLSEACKIRPPKAEARAVLSDDDLVSFFPMEDLGVFQKEIVAVKERKLKDVAGSYTYFANNDVLLAKITPCFENGKLGIARNLTNGVGFGSSEYIVFRPDERLLPEYLFYFLSLDEFREEGKRKMMGSVGHKRVSQEFIENSEIPIPPIEEQRRIVAILDEAFACIDKAKANTEKNIQNARELFDSYLNNIFSNPGPDWDSEPIAEICTLKSGTTIPKALEKSSGEIPYVKVGDMNLAGNESEIVTSSRFVEKKDVGSSQIIPAGAIIFPKRGGAIATNKKRAVTRPIIADLNTMAIIPGKRLSSKLFYHWFKLIDLNELSNGTSVPQINNYSFDDVFVPFPASIDEQTEITNNLDGLRDLSKSLEADFRRKVVELDELKKSILQKAFNGELV